MGTQRDSISGINLKLIYEIACTCPWYWWLKKWKLEGDLKKDCKRVQL